MLAPDDTLPQIINRNADAPVEYSVAEYLAPLIRESVTDVVFHEVVQDLTITLTRIGAVREQLPF